MRSPSTPSQEVPASSRKLNDDGFSLLEVIVALAIMAIGYTTVFNLFSVSIKSVGMSDQYMRATRLADSKLNEMEMMNYEVETLSGTFKNEDGYRWSMEIQPYESPLNDEEYNIGLSKVVLRVDWQENQKQRNVELTTLKLDGTSSPAPDSLLAEIFSGGVSAQDGQQSPDSPTDSPSDSPTGSPGQNVSGSGSGGISGGGGSFNFSGN